MLETLKRLDQNIFKFMQAYTKGYIGQSFSWQYIAITSNLLLFFAIHFMFSQIAKGFPLTPSPATDIEGVNHGMLLAHVFLSCLPLAVGPWMFHSEFRQKNPEWHRKLGYFYVVGCLLGAISVLPLAMNNRSFIGPIGFSVMGITWFFITLFAYTAAVRGQFVAHRRWMMRSFGMTYAFVHVNFTYKLLGLSYIPNGEIIKTLQSLISWLFNLMIIEIYLASTAPNGRSLTLKQWGKNMINPFNGQDKMYFGPIIPYRRNKDKKA